MSSSRTLSSSSSAPDPSESLQSVLERCPSKNLKTPAAGKAVAIRPLKRVKKDAPAAAAAGAGTVMAEDPPALNLDDNEENAPRGLLSPRKLDMDQEVVLAASALSPGGEEEKQEVQPTQPQQIAADEEEEEEGELPPPAMERTMSVNFGPYVV